MLASIIRPSLVVIFLVIAAGSWMGTARLVRGEVLALRERDYVAAARVFGAHAHRIVLRHRVPNALGVVVVAGVNNVFNGFWWQLWPPAIALVLVELAVNVVGDGIRDVVEQRLIRR